MPLRSGPPSEPILGIASEPVMWLVFNQRLRLSVISEICGLRRRVCSVHNQRRSECRTNNGIARRNRRYNKQTQVDSARRMTCYRVLAPRAHGASERVRHACATKRKQTVAHTHAHKRTSAFTMDLGDFEIATMLVCRSCNRRHIGKRMLRHGQKQ